jgi:hypothetical protein
MNVVLDIEAERKKFEDAAYLQYLMSETDARDKAKTTARATGQPVPTFSPMMTQKLFAKRNEDDGKYALVGVDSAWWGWKERAELALADVKKELEEG